MNKYNFSIIEPNETDWEYIESCPDCTVFHTRMWDNYLSSIGRKHFILSITNSDTSRSKLGYFIATIRRFGIKIIASPGGGAGTYVQGLCTQESLTSDGRMSIYQELVHYIFKNRLASYIQISDWHLSFCSSEWSQSPNYGFSFHETNGFRQHLRATLFIDTSLPEDQLWTNLKYKSCKYCINKAKKLGLRTKVIDRWDEIPVFVDTLSELIQNVSKRKHEKRHIHHNKKHLLALCLSLFPDRVLMIQVLGTADDGIEHVMASAIFCIGSAASTYFSGASNEKYMKYCPNELMVWEGLKLLNKQKAGDLILGGVAPYKRKFGSTYAFLPMMVFSRYKFLGNMRSLLKNLYSFIRRKL